MIKEARIYNGERQSLQKMVFEKLKGYMQKNKAPQQCTLCNHVRNKKKGNLQKNIKHGYDYSYRNKASVISGN